MWVRSDLAEKSPVSSRHTRHRLAGLSVPLTWVPLSLVLLSSILLTGCAAEPSKRPESHSKQAATALAQLQQAIVERDQSKLDPELGYLVANARALDIRGFTARWADQISGGSHSFVGSVQISYRFGGFDRGESRLPVAVTFQSEGHGTRVHRIGGNGERTPLWLSGPVQARSSGQSLVVAAAAIKQVELSRLSAMSATAHRQVAKVIADPGPLVVEVPATVQELNDALLAAPNQYDDIAAVATTPDGALIKGSPIHVFINPGVFFAMDHVGAQVVLTHEATHVAMEAPFATMPTWLREGFADYVALASADVPVQVAAARYLQQVRTNGLPQELPTDADLDPRNGDFAVAYEGAWLVCRTIADHFGEDSLVRLYRSAGDGADPGPVIQQELGVSEPQLVKVWRNDLAKLAGIAG